MTESPDIESLLNAAQGGAAEDQFALGQHYVHQNEFGRARRWLSRAGNQGHGGALVELGLLKLRGLGISASPHDAAQHFREAAQNDHPAGHYELATLLYRGLGVEQDLPGALRSLMAAARAGHGPALTTCAFLAEEAGDSEQASRTFLLAAEAGEPFAQGAIAQRLAQGVGIESNASDARYWAQQAVANGNYCMAQFHQLHAGEPVGTPSASPGIAAADLPDLEFPSLSARQGDEPAPGKTIRVYPAMYRHEECEYLIEAAAPYLLPSHTVHPETGEAVHNEFRTSHGWSFHRTQEDIVILRVKERLALQTGLPVQHAEPFAMLRYQLGQEYKAHFDFIDPASGEAGQEISRNGQRQQTIFSYLTTVAEGGETEFRRLQVKIPPVEGHAVQFHNVLEDGRPDPESLHASLPVVNGEKWLATLWFRDRPLYR